MQVSKSYRNLLTCNLSFFLMDLNLKVIQKLVNLHMLKHSAFNKKLLLPFLFEEKKLLLPLFIIFE